MSWLSDVITMRRHDGEAIPQLIHEKTLQLRPTFFNDGTQIIRYRVITEILDQSSSVSLLAV